ncbi:hypothetical protein [Mariprofundus ferrooxydans]|uniref:hypothetical protein n=1 Tax=Mariprofundus ferrooxydans TaxID=314344 RepID=UPI001430069C|nr:hypothetical protein [Mariprofundus ferrooxydans]
MRLQVNDSGAWRNVIDFSAADTGPVLNAAAVLAEAGGVKNMRVLDHDIVVGYCEKPAYQWEHAG